MGSILNKIQELFDEGMTYEETRPTYRPIGINFFDAMDGESGKITGCRIPDVSPAATTKDRDTTEDVP